MACIGRGPLLRPATHIEGARRPAIGGACDAAEIRASADGPARPRQVLSTGEPQAPLALISAFSRFAILSSRVLMAWSWSSKCAWISSDSWKVASASL
jgi:hypothetical protein